MVKNPSSLSLASWILFPLFLHVCWLWRRVLTCFSWFSCPTQNQLQTFPLESYLWMPVWLPSGNVSFHLFTYLYLIVSCWSLKLQCLVFLYSFWISSPGFWIDNMANAILQEWKMERFGHDGSKRCLDLTFLRGLKLAPTEVTAVITSLVLEESQQEAP